MKLAQAGLIVGGLVVALAVAAGAPAQRQTATGATAVAQLLRERDPGKRLGGNTIVVTGNQTRIVGVPHRPNFIIALGKGDTIVGGGRGDQIGALAANVTLVAGSAGHELLVGGPAGKVVAGGAGHDMVVEAKPGATIVVSSAGDRIVVQGRNDRVRCVGNSFHDVIRVGSTARVDVACKRHHDTILPLSEYHPFKQSLRTAQSSTIFGSGTNENPYVAECDDGSQFTVTTGPETYINCAVSTFAPRSLTGLWANEYVPAYKCPRAAPFLRNVNYWPGPQRGRHFRPLISVVAGHPPRSFLTSAGVR